MSILSLIEFSDCITFGFLIFLTPRTVGFVIFWLDNRWVRDFMDCWNVGFVILWIVEMLGLWFPDFFDSTTFGFVIYVVEHLLVLWFIDYTTVVLWFIELMKCWVLWFLQLLKYCICGLLNRWNVGFVISLIAQLLVLWFIELLKCWICDFFDCTASSFVVF